MNNKILKDWKIQKALYLVEDHFLQFSYREIPENF